MVNYAEEFILAIDCQKKERVVLPFFVEKFL